MTAAMDRERFRQPTVKRLGLEDGWWFFCSHFLNLGFPLLFVDACLFPEADQLGLENLDTRRPDTPWPPVDLRVGLLGGGARLYGATSPPRLVTGHWFRQITFPELPSPRIIGVAVGDSYALQLSMSAFWTCRVGTAVVIESPTL